LLTDYLTTHEKSNEKAERERERRKNCLAERGRVDSRDRDAEMYS
jgi:hypothetical protein